MIDPADHLRRFRDRIARHRFVNWTTSVHTRLDIDLTAADRFLADHPQEPGAPPLNREHLWLCATARVLVERPLFNVAYDGLRRVEPRRDVHLRVSLERDGRLAWGVIEHADRLDPPAMARARADLAAQAQGPEVVAAAPPRHRGRLGRLLDDLVDTAIDFAPQLEPRLGSVSGAEAGTFTVLDAGAFGAEDLHVVLLRPAVAQLVVMKPRQVVEPGEGGAEVRTRVPMAVPFCHKVMDTDAAGYFLHHLQQLLEDPQQLFRPAGGPKEAS